MYLTPHVRPRARIDIVSISQKVSFADAVLEYTSESINDHSGGVNTAISGLFYADVAWLNPCGCLK